MFATLALVLAVVAASFAFLNFNQANDERARAEKEARIASARSLAGQASMQLQLHNDELASLLALQAWNFNEGTEGEAWAQVDAALRQTMAAPFFSRVLPQDAAVQALAFHPQGTMVATGDREGVVQVWNLLDPAAPSILLPGTGEWVTAIAFSPEGRLLAIGTRDGSISLYEAGFDGPVAMTLQAPHGSVDTLLFSGNTLLATVDGEPSLYTWDLGSSGDPNVLALVDGWSAGAVTIDPARHRLVAGIAVDDTVRLWEPDRPERAMTVLPGQEGWTPVAMAFGATGRSLVASGTDGSLRLWRLDQPVAMPAVIPAVSPTTSITAVAMDPSGKRVAGMTYDGAVVIWSVDDPSAPDVLLGHENVGLTAVFSPDGAFLATGGGDTARLWTLSPPTEPMVLRGHTEAVRSVAYSPDGRMIASGGLDGTILIWDTAGLERPRTLLNGNDGDVIALTFTPNNRTLASGSSTGTVRLWHLDDLSREATVLPGKGLVTSIAYAPDGQHLAVAHGSDVVVWDLRAEIEPVARTLPFLDQLQGQRAQSIAFNPQGTTLAAGGCVAAREPGVCDRGGVVLWSMDQPEHPPTTLEHADDSIMAIAFDASGQVLGAVGKDGAVRTWDMDDLTRDGVMLRTSGAASLAFSPTGELAIGHWNGTITVWRLDRPVSPSLISAHHGYVYSLAYAPDGRMLAAGGSDGTVQLWSSTETLAGAVCGRVGRDLSEQEWSRFVGEAAPSQPVCPDLPPGISAAPDASLRVEQSG
jgi:WD40 repeat protein